jgi:hypothetical protein
VVFNKGRFGMPWTRLVKKSAVEEGRLAKFNEEKSGIGVLGLNGGKLPPGGKNDDKAARTPEKLLRLACC